MDADLDSTGAIYDDSRAVAVLRRSGARQKRAVGFDAVFRADCADVRPLVCCWIHAGVWLLWRGAGAMDRRPREPLSGESQHGQCQWLYPGNPLRDVSVDLCCDYACADRRGFCRENALFGHADL